MRNAVTSWLSCSPATRTRLHEYITCIPFHSINCIAPHRIALHCILHCTALRCIPHCIPHCVLNSAFCTALHCIALHRVALHCTTLHCTALHCTALHCTALHCLSRDRGSCSPSQHDIPSPPIALHSIAQTLLSHNPGVRSRFPTVIQFEDYSVAELERIADQMLGKVLNCNVLHCTVLYCDVLYCTVL